MHAYLFVLHSPPNVCNRRRTCFNYHIRRCNFCFRLPHTQISITIISSLFHLMEEEESQLAHPLPPSSAHTDSTAASLDPSGGSLILLPSGIDRSLLSWNGKIARSKWKELDVRLSCQILEDKPNLSRWSLKYKAFGQNIEYSGLARNVQPKPNQKIHWLSQEGLPHRGAVRFFPKGPSSCIIEALKPFLENLLAEGLERSATFAKSYSADTPK